MTEPTDIAAKKADAEAVIAKLMEVQTLIESLKDAPRWFSGFSPPLMACRSSTDAQIQQLRREFQLEAPPVA